MSIAMKPSVHHFALAVVVSVAAAAVAVGIGMMLQPLPATSLPYARIPLHAPSRHHGMTPNRFVAVNVPSCAQVVGLTALH